MKRKGFYWVSAVALLVVATHSRTEAQHAAAKLPNLILITIDTLRPDHLECYGYKALKTPRINDLASDGILFENAYTAIPITLPAHASILTGTYPVFHGVRDFTGFTLSKDRTTLAEMLKPVGYATGAVVGAAVLEAGWGLNQGFDFYYDNFPFTLDRDRQTIAERRGDVVVREGLSWLEKNKKGPIFLWLHLFDPHDPYEPPAPYDRQYRDRLYDGEIAFTDDNVGMIIGYLKRNDLYDRSLVVLLGDHGESLGEHGEKYHGFLVYDATLRIPMIFKLPAGSGAGKRIAAPVRTIDVVPTVLQILGLTGKVRATEVQGRGAYASMLGKSSLGEIAVYAESFMSFYHFDWSPLISIRRGPFKLVDAPKPEFYDTVADPLETRNLHAEKGALAAQFKELLRQTISQYSPKTAIAAVPKDVDPATMEKLQSLGYVAVSKGKIGPILDRSLPDPKDKIEIYELIREGSRSAQQKNFNRAVRNLTEALRREPGSLIGHFQLGTVYHVLGALEKAEREFQRVLELKPDYTLALHRLGEIYIAGQRYSEAENSYKKILSQSPNDFLAYFNLGGLHLLQEQWDAALAAYRKAQALKANDAKIQSTVGRILLQKGDLAGAAQEAQQAVKLNPNLVEAHQTLMELYRKQGRTAEAEKEAQILERLQAKP